MGDIRFASSVRRRRRSIVVIASVAVIVGMLTGCAAPAPFDAASAAADLGAFPASVPLAGEQVVLAVEQQRDASWAMVAARWPGAERPEVAGPTFIEGEDRSAWAECLQRAGFETTVTIDPPAIYEPPTPENADEAVSAWICDAEHLLPPVAAPTEAQLGYLYDWFTLVVAPCVAANGFSVPDAPTRAAFIGAARPGPWSPADEVPADRMEEVANECGFYPEGSTDLFLNGPWYEEPAAG